MEAPPREEQTLGLFGVTLKIEYANTKYGFEWDTDGGTTLSMGNKTFPLGFDSKGRVTLEEGGKIKVDPNSGDTRLSLGWITIDPDSGMTKLAPTVGIGAAGLKVGPQVGLNPTEALDRVTEPVARQVRGIENINIRSLWMQQIETRQAAISAEIERLSSQLPTTDFRVPRFQPQRYY